MKAGLSRDHESGQGRAHTSRSGNEWEQGAVAPADSLRSKPVTAAAAPVGAPFTGAHPIPSHLPKLLCAINHPRGVSWKDGVSISLQRKELDVCVAKKDVLRSMHINGGSATSLCKTPIRKKVCLDFNFHQSKPSF